MVVADHFMLLCPHPLDEFTPIARVTFYATPFPNENGVYLWGGGSLRI